MRWLFRWLYEKFNIYIYIIIPLLLILLSNSFKHYISKELLQEYSMEFSLIFAVYFLGCMGVLVTIPSSEKLVLLQKYKHIQIVFFTLAIGNISSLLLLVVGFLNYNEYSVYLYITVIVETVIATIKLFNISKFINKK